MANGSRLGSFLRSVPIAWVALGALGGAVGFGILAQRSLDAQLTLPARVTELEEWRQSQVDPALRFLVCSQRATNAGQNPQPCEIVLRGADYLLDIPATR